MVKTSENKLKSKKIWNHLCLLWMKGSGCLHTSTLYARNNYQLTHGIHSAAVKAAPVAATTAVGIGEVIVAVAVAT